MVYQLLKLDLSAARFARKGLAYSATQAAGNREAKVRRGGDFYTRHARLSGYARGQTH